ncbi:MAG: hypothetical protein LC734_11650, partial [Acidobacteria bacterium]|nr:hypothetical protein [Acidobacteriota bacterium]
MNRELPAVGDDFLDAHPKPFGAFDIVFFALTFLFVYSQVFQFPARPIYFEGDHLIPVSNAMRMLEGETIYKDFFHLTPPGVEVIYQALFSVFGVRIWILNAVIVGIGFAQIWLLWFFGRQVLTGFLAFAPAIVYLVIGFRHFGIDGSYRIFSVIFVLLAVAVLMRSQTASRLLVAGCLCGLASFFVQTRGLVGLAGIGIFVLWENFTEGFDFKSLVRDALLLGSSFIAVIFLTQIYFLLQAGFGNYYFNLVTFLHVHYPNDPLAKTSAVFSDLPHFASYLDVYSIPAAISRYVRFAAPLIFYYSLIPLVYLVFLILRWRGAVSAETAIDKRLMLVSLVGIFLTVGVSAPTAGRLYHIAIPGLIILFWLVSHFRTSRVIGVTASILLAIVGAAYIVQRQIVPKYNVEMP